MDEYRVNEVDKAEIPSVFPLLALTPVYFM